MSPDVAATEQPAAPSRTDFGLDAEEQAAYEGMRESGPATGEPGFAAEPEAPAAEPVADTVAEPVAAESPAGAQTAVDLGDDGDDDEPAPNADGTSPPKTKKRIGWTIHQRALADLAAEREKNVKAAETQARLDERLRLINEALTPQQQAPVDDDPRPDPETDIFGHAAWQERRIAKLEAAQNERFSKMEEESQAQIADRQLANSYVEDAQKFAQIERNFGPAYEYLMQVRQFQLASFHFGKDLTDPATPALTPQELAKIKSEVAREEKQLVSTAMKAGKSPAAEVFRMAKMTGYRPQAAPAAPAVQNGAAPASAPAPAPQQSNGVAKPSVKAVIDGIKNGQGVALSLSNAGGAPAPVLDARKLADMPEEEFSALLDQMSRGELRRIMGGAA